MASKAPPYSAPILRGASMPHNSTEIWRSPSRRSSASSAPRVTLGSMPRKASLAPSSTITASVPSGTDQSRRASPPEAVSPDTPALAISAAMPLAASARCSRTGNASSAARPYPAVRESPSATILIGCSEAGAAGSGLASNPPANVTATSERPIFTPGAGPPYERSGRFFQFRRGNHIHMDDTSAAVRPHIPAISLSGVNLSLGRGAGRVHILKDIALNIRRGEAIGLVGPSGSGKSTLLMVMAGLERPDAGEVAVDGEDIGRLDEDALARFRARRIGIVIQSFHLIPTMTALENVATPLELAGARDAFRRAAAELETVGLGSRLGHYPAQLSGGEQQRVALARALVAEPAILVADEPTGNLDETTGRRIIDVMFDRFAAQAMTLILVTHDASLAARCDRVIRLRSGRVEEQAATASG